ncbi:hypothetical protein CR203_12880 [Salipaludibacillus neizhouensis]|uniref:DUF2953 domain-containing protein n=1 Tax=Salipaludibacillus neizhouensis TaxID=885475 RepID=A0A3A9K2Z8_9BACI|nr:DUF2953 domain-containing protein [Salipaludibacillus neizhouensis]RKL66729.1 hypothetical protein CR203_12880 [Salipaludibacillus neizhouensis]
MYVTLTVLGIVFLLLILVCIMKLTIETKIKTENKDFDGEIRFFLYFRWLGYKMKIPAIDLDKESPSIVFKESDEALEEDGQDKKKKFSIFELIYDLELLSEFLRNTVGFYKILQKFLKKISITNLSWDTKFGLEEADKTGAACGVVWSLKGGILGILAKYMKLKSSPNMQVQPLFNQLYLSSSFQCMVSFRMGYAILTVIKVLLHRRKVKGKRKVKFKHSKGRNIHV